MARQNDQFLSFLPEPAEAAALNATDKWQILIVDDEPDVHDTTILALKKFKFSGKGLQFYHAYSAAQAIDLLQNHEYAVMVVDVVMETDDAGFKLVRYLRETLKNDNTRIILRTGQPGYAPEIDTIKKYDINDYKTKSELTQARLYTAMALAIRSYTQIQQLNFSQRGLEQIVVAANLLNRPLGQPEFAITLLQQLCLLLNINEPCDALAVVNDFNEQPFVVAATGKYSPWFSLQLSSISDQAICTAINRAITTKNSSYNTAVNLFLSSKNKLDLVCYLNIGRPLTSIEKSLLKNFSGSAAIALKNLQMAKTINDLAYIDSLVGLPNKNSLFAAIEAGGSKLDTLALVDIDNFADINSIIDGDFGDDVLRAVARHLRVHFNPDVLVTRLGGDLFGLYGSSKHLNPATVKAVFKEPLQVKDDDILRLSVTSGFVKIYANNKTAAVVLREASAALKQAKGFHRGGALYFQRQQADAARDRINLLNKLRASLSERHFYLNYQPFISLKTGHLVGAEALLRWQTADGAFIAPDKFIPIAEQSGLMVPIGEWVLYTACKWRAQMASHVNNNFRIAINVSQVQLIDPGFVPSILNILASTGVAGSQVELELTESIAIQNMDLLLDKLAQLRSHGITIAMDDFGTGYSSLSVIQQLSVDRLKIDRSFISGTGCHKNNVDITSTIIALAKQLNIATIAEGIETKEQLQLLKGYGCDDGQGYFFSRPLSEDDFYLWLDKYQQRNG